MSLIHSFVCLCIFFLVVGLFIVIFSKNIDAQEQKELIIVICISIIFCYVCYKLLNLLYILSQYYI